MASPIDTVISSLRINHPNITLYTPHSMEYQALNKTYIISPARPSAITRPKTAEDVQAVVKACVAHGADFSIRTGGHNCVGRTLVDNTLTIDMRDIDHVKISEDKKTAKIGGGALSGKVLANLAEHGLVTPCGSVASVGYVGWTTLGGYGPYSTIFGLGVDQIISAKLVNGKGEIVDADEDLLKGIRGAGPIFGPIFEVTAKVYELKKLLVATLVFDPTDLNATWTTITQGIQNLTVPDALQIQLAAMDFPGVGKALALVVTWASDDHNQGRRWIEKISSLGTCIANQTVAKTPAQHIDDNEKIIPYGVYGRSYTINIKEWTAETASILARYTQLIPGGSAMISVHTLRSPMKNEDSVFGARTSHHMIEVISMTSQQSLEFEAVQWGQALIKELRETDAMNILDSSYIALLDYDDSDLKKIYGEYYATLVELKMKHDPNNAIRHAAPRVSVYGSIKP